MQILSSPRDSFCRAAVVFFAVMMASSAVGQELQVFQFSTTSPEGSQDGKQPRISVGGLSGVALDSGGAMLGGGTVFGVDPNNRSALFNLLANESVRRELQLKEEQIASVQKIQQETQKRMSEVMRANMAAGNPPVNGVRELMEEGRKTAESSIEEILLPEQLARVRQIAYQIEIAQVGLGESLTSGRLGKEIDVHDDQKQHLTDKATAIEAETRLAIAKIRAAAREKLLAELAPEQRKKAEALVGPYFEYEEPNFAKALHQRIKQVAPAKK